MSRIVIAMKDNSGQTMAEYAMVLGVITLAIVTTLSVLSGAMEAAFDRTVDIVSLVR